MMRSCLVLLLAYVALFALYAQWLGQELDSPERYVGAGIMALVAGGGLGALYNAWVARREWSLVAVAQHGLPWSDGSWAAVAGDIHPAGEPVIAPFSGQLCALCEYEMSLSESRPVTSDSQHKPGVDFAGFLMNGCVIRSQFGEVRLLGFPNLVRFGWRNCEGPGVAANTRAFLSATDFENLSGIKLVSVFSAIKSAWTDDDGVVHKHLRLCKQTPQEVLGIHQSVEQRPVAADEPAPGEEDEVDEEDWDDENQGEDADEFAAAVDRWEAQDDNPQWVPSSTMLLKERRVKVGEKVCAFGIYSAANRGLVPGGLGADRFIKLVRGDAKTIEQEARGSFWRNLSGGLIALVVVHLAGWGVLLAAAAQK